MMNSNAKTFLNMSEADVGTTQMHMIAFLDTVDAICDLYATDENSEGKALQLLAEKKAILLNALNGCVNARVKYVREGKRDCPDNIIPGNFRDRRNRSRRRIWKERSWDDGPLVS